MARLHSCGFEMQSPRGEASFAEGSPAISTAQARSGAASLVVTGAAHQTIDWEWVGVLGRSYFARVWFFSAVAKPTNFVQICNLANTEFAYAGSIHFNTDGTLSLHNKAGTQIGAKTAAIEANRWYCLELLVKVAAAPTEANGEIRGRLDGVEFAGSAATNAGTKAINYLYGVDTTGAIGGNLFIDDVAANDDQGENQNSYPGPAGKIVILKPTSDVGRDAGWLAGGGATTNLWDAVNNTPPVGVALGSATNTSQIKDAVNNATDVYEPGLQNYTTYMATTDKTLLVQALARGANSTTTSRELAIQATVNPVIAESKAGTGGTAGGTEPTGWTTVRTAYLYNPETNFGFEPRIKVRKGTASTDSMMYDFMGLLVEYQPVPLVLTNPASIAFTSSMALQAQTSVPLNPASIAFTSSMALQAQTGVPLQPATISFTGSLGLRVRQLLNRIRVNEAPPMRQYIIATAPSGKPYRWSEDDLQGDHVFTDLVHGSSVPGGCKDFSASLPRKAGVDYSDMIAGTDVEIIGAGGIRLWKGRLQDAPRSSGDHIVMDPAAVGYQAHLSDDESAQCIPIDADMTGWGEPSARRRVAFPTNLYNINAQVELLPAGDPQGGDVAAITHSWSRMDNQGGTKVDLATSAYISDIEIGRVLLDFLNVAGIGPGDVNWVNALQYAADDVSAVSTAKDFDGTSTTNYEGVIPSGQRYLQLTDFYNPGAFEGESNWQAQWRNVKVTDRSGIPIYGTWPNVGVLASDVIAYLLSRWAPLIDFTTGVRGSLRPSNFIIPHLPFKTAEAIKGMIEAALRFELLEWGVWPGQFGPTFHLNARGTREGRKRWRIRARDADLKETGQSMQALCNGVVVEYKDVDNTMRTIGPTGSGARLTSDDLLDRDPENPLNDIPGLKKWPKIAMKDVSTEIGAIERGKRYIEAKKLLDSSGEATLPAVIEDSSGTRWPYYCAQGGDLADFLDGRGERYIVDATPTRSSRSCPIHLDAPPDSEEAMLERLNVTELSRGL